MNLLAYFQGHAALGASFLYIWIFAIKPQLFSKNGSQLFHTQPAFIPTVTSLLKMSKSNMFCIQIYALNIKLLGEKDENKL